MEEVRQENKMSRADFLKKTAFGAAAAALVLKFGGATDVIAAPVQQSDETGGQTVGAVPPIDKTKTWIDTSVGGVLKYWNGKEWTPVQATWG